MNTWGSVGLYAGSLLALAAALAIIVPGRFRRRAFGAGLALAILSLLFPVSTTSRSHAASEMDLYLRHWQFREVHEIKVHASRDRVFQATLGTTPDEIQFYQSLTAIRRFASGAFSSPDSILHAPGGRPLLETATRTGFLKLAEVPGTEYVIGSVLRGPPVRTPQEFAALRHPGAILAVLSFQLEADGGRDGWTTLRTETRVFADGPAAKQIFAAYWRAIYPGSSLIRTMWLRAIRERAEKN